jgi:hypothetical protein
MEYPLVITIENSDRFIPSVMFSREKKIWRAYPSVRPSVFCRWVVFLFMTELTMERGVTDDYYTDGHVPSVRPSVIISPMEFIPFTDGISPSVNCLMV